MTLRGLLVTLLGCSVVASVTPALAQTAEPLPPPPYGQPYYQQPYYQQPYYQPAPQPYYQPAPPPPPYYQPVRVGFRPQFGLGVRALGSWNVNDYTEFTQGGIGLDLLLRASPHLTTELNFGYQHTGFENPDYDRTDVPLTLGLRIHPGRLSWPVSPYLVFAAGGSYARLNLPGAFEEAWFFEAQAGGGLEIRVGRHFAITGDLRATTRLRVDPGPHLAVTDSLGATHEVAGHQFGLQFNAGLAAYF